MSGPVLLVVDDDVEALRDIDEAAGPRYGSHSRIGSFRSPFEARDRLDELAHDDDRTDRDDDRCEGGDAAWSVGGRGAHAVSLPHPGVVRRRAAGKVPAHPMKRVRTCVPQKA